MLSFQRMERFSFLFPLLWLSPYDGLSWLQTWLHWEKQASVCVAEGISRCDWVRGPLNWRINNRKWKAVVEGYLKEVGNREVAWKNPLLSSPPPPHSSCLLISMRWAVLPYHALSAPPQAESNKSSQACTTTSEIRSLNSSSSKWFLSGICHTHESCAATCRGGGALSMT